MALNAASVNNEVYQDDDVGNADDTISITGDRWNKRGRTGVFPARDVLEGEQLEQQVVG
jgi:hypothetical protein